MWRQWSGVTLVSLGLLAAGPTQAADKEALLIGGVVAAAALGALLADSRDDGYFRHDQRPSYGYRQPSGRWQVGFDSWQERRPSEYRHDNWQRPQPRYEYRQGYQQGYQQGIRDAQRYNYYPQRRW